jgi:broad specificity phosphatase PhoE
MNDYLGERRKLSNSTPFSGNILIVSHGSPIAACHIALSGKNVYVGQCTISKYSMHEEPQTQVDNQENDELINEAVQEFMIKSDKYYFKPHLLGDSSHLSDRTNLRDRE